MRVKPLVKAVLFALAEQRVGKGARMLSIFFNPRHGLEVR